MWGNAHASSSIRKLSRLIAKKGETCRLIHNRLYPLAVESWMTYIRTKLKDVLFVDNNHANVIRHPCDIWTVHKRIKDIPEVDLKASFLS
jgi:hypothetical protein